MSAQQFFQHIFKNKLLKLVKSFLCAESQQTERFPCGADLLQEASALFIKCFPLQQKVAQDLFPRPRQELLHCLPVIFHLLPLSALLFDLRLYFPQDLRYPFLIAGLQHVVAHAQLHCLAGVFIFPVPGEHDELYGRKFFPCRPDQPDPVHDRHLDIRQDNVRTGAPDLLKPVRAVPRGSGKFHAVFLPGDELRHPLSFYLFVIHDQQSVHLPLPLSSSVSVSALPFPLPARCLSGTRSPHRRSSGAPGCCSARSRFLWA